MSKTYDSPCQPIKVIKETNLEKYKQKVKETIDKLMPKRDGSCFKKEEKKIWKEKYGLSESLTNCLLLEVERRLLILKKELKLE